MKSIIEELNNKNITMLDIALKLNVNPSTVYRWKKTQVPKKYYKEMLFLIRKHNIHIDEVRF
jgi:uncharacterized protein YjcR